jgi:8-oxo-dGTP pyrophosphatase MutT (NUDIX family)
VLCDEFDSMWSDFWQSGQCRSFVKEYELSKSRLMTLRTGYYLRSADAPSELVFLDLAGALAATTPKYCETEYGFPKGRRNMNESDLQCARREFEEETGVDASRLVMVPGVKPFEEVFTGSNHVRYRHVYFLAWLRPHPEAEDRVVDLPVDNPVQMKEVRAVAWVDGDAVMARIRDENPERREMFRRVQQMASQLPRAARVTSWHGPPSR